MRPTDTNDPTAAMPFDVELDARGLQCPLPVLKTRRAIDAMTAGQVLKVVATDPGSVRDLEAFARHTGHPLLLSAQTGGEFVHYLRKR